MTAVAAGEQADVFFPITKQPMYVKMPDSVMVPTSRHMLVRGMTADDPHYRPFGVVSDTYEHLENRQVAELLDKHLTGKYPVETVGALEYGKTIFFLLRMGDGEIGGDAVVKYLLATDRRDGGSALKIASVVERVVCANTLAAALGSALATFNVVHRTGHVDLVDDRMSILARVEGTMAETINRLERLTTLPLTPAQVDQVVAAAFPKPKPPRKLSLGEQLSELGVPLTAAGIDFDAITSDFTNAAERMELFRSAAKLNILRFNDEYPRYGGTGWATYNGIVEFCDFREGGTDFEAAKSALFGWRAEEKSRALREIEAIMAGSAS